MLESIHSFLYKKNFGQGGMPESFLKKYTNLAPKVSSLYSSYKEKSSQERVLTIFTIQTICKRWWINQ